MHPTRVRKLKWQDCYGRFRTIAVFDVLGDPIAATCIDGDDEKKSDYSRDSFLCHEISGKLPLNKEHEA